MEKKKTKINDILLIICLCIALIIILVLKIYNSNDTLLTENNINLPSTETDKTISISDTVNSSVSSIESQELDISDVANQVIGQKVTDPNLQKNIFDKAVQSIVVTEEIKNQTAGLPSDYPFVNQNTQKYWWDVFKIFDRYSPLTSRNQHMQITSNYKTQTTELTLRQLNSISENTDMLQMTTTWPNANIKQYHNGNYILYEIDQTTSVVQENNSDSFDQNIIFKSKPNTNQIVTNLQLSTDLKINQIETGELIVTDKNNNGWMFILPTNLVDRKGNSIIMPMQFNSDTNQITWQLDKNFMDKASYPVVMQF